MKTHKYLRIPSRILTLALVAVLFSSCYKQELVIDKVPLNTPAGEAIYVAGNFNNWDPGDEKYRMTSHPDGTYSISLPRGIGQLNYKYTRGDWTRGERNECGYEIDNRTLTYGESEIETDQVACWGDTEPMNCSQTVIVLRDYPENTPEEAMIYLASQYNNWNPGDLKQTLQKHPGGYYYINVDKQGDCIEFKFTLGDWGTVETDGNGKDIDNRRYCYDRSDTLFLKVKEWKSISFRKLGKVTFILDKLPALTQPGEKFYITGDFNNWNPGDQAYTFRKDSLGRLYFTLMSDMEIISFKITRGSWKSVETLPSARDIPNRTHVNGQADTVYLNVERWKDR
ncbi:MAG: hypothetical protein HGA37_17235 [Lentimicrobium sp.]|nr:hypothetical protein [Lentimicrobium sp.]